MKALRNILMLAVVVGIVFIQSCDNESGPSEEQLFLDKLKGTWTLTTGHVRLDGKDVTNSFAGMEISFGADKSYAVANAVSPIWPESGTFRLEKSGSAGLFNIIRSDDILITVSDLAASTVTLKFQYTSASGRSKSLSGQYEFVMNR
jgi:hypothetical protein